MTEAETTLRQRGESETAAASGAKEDQGKPCPMSGKYGTCPVSGLLSSSPAAKKKDPFAAGAKSMVPATTEASSSAASGESFLWALCPIHWERNTLYLILLAYVLGILNGLVVAKWFIY
ncbi:unnamed protein product [Amoebophrya sp. A120]|nr:unnamed protein product [Amoebophrya sp. A120]|eukprot:GSA120T00008280001.1